MEYILNKQYKDEEVYFDGSHYIGCSFTNCTIHIQSLSFNYDRCTFAGSKFKLSPKLLILQNVYSLLPSSMSGSNVVQA
ncbi:hypothetical protein BK133_19735 [Paenibacillus sp. FSL H8-0548]|uniref:hypothetical protein n=1 Tax=Paenibacillus sp. FSL H8-0548 TaxID=1920422 RepID=UPI0009701110|nr:hypothetical protein [Paenibacillus sp. FSL H8-0548]OMF27187.1 hypothetical protein BK133_19735 [Paenibacillus sp. FSL H8-0548]